MILSLHIDNIDSLPGGGPLSYRSHARGFEIGREDRDWTLPDPDKFISGRHCEVRFEQNAFWLHDVSRNGTFVNGSSQRLTSPHRLTHGDRIRVGRYLVRVLIEDVLADGSAGVSGPGFVSSSDDWRTSQPQRPAMAPLPAEAVMLQAIATAAGLSPDALSQRSPNEVGADIGAVLRIVVAEVSTLLKARAAAKALVRSNQRTMIGAADNNPLKFVPGADEILEILFAKRRPGYLDARDSFKDAFRDLKTHEVATYAAMQTALSRLLDDLSPESIAKRVPPSSFGSMKAKSWDVIVATWRAREDANENGMLDVFLAYFSEAYAKASETK